MNKKALLVLAACMAASSAAYADNSAGCGLGTVLFEGKEKKAHLILAATTNGCFGNQTFGISSETLGCTSKGGWVKNEKKQEVYAEVNLQKLSKEMAQGGGEYLSAFASLMGAKDEATKKAFFKLTQEKYESLFPTANTDSVTMLRNLKTAMAAEPKLASL